MESIKFMKENYLFYLDQRLLPQREVWRQSKTLKQTYTAIKQLRVRGAPLIGVFAGYGFAICALKFSDNKDTFKKQALSALDYLKSARPTAVNLFWALDRMAKVLTQNITNNTIAIKKAFLIEANSIHKQDIMLCNNMAKQGLHLIKKSDRILTHCNTGFLATAGIGTALGVITGAHKKYRDIFVYVDETRPLLQGARLTAWELAKMNVPCKLISDNMAAYCMRQGLIDKVFLGADRIAANGDTANKIGTYNVAVAARYHKIPFYVVAPFSTFDVSIKTGAQIKIEQRMPDEVRKVCDRIYIAPKDIDVYNPAFDVTPAELITAIVTDRGVIYPPFKTNIRRILGKHDNIQNI
ncbi:MAG: S-methyl-5-thioribose-1-phosphate isomerase [Candidatus Omnitrophica bacterium]|nr:S-methyl-5-thioribose-1-phosphate isomerase [Candidatus Omnitrophota bacterium]